MNDGCDLNGHVGEGRGGVERWHGGRGIGQRNLERQRILDFVMAQDIAMLNTFFDRDYNQLATFKSGGRSS